MVNVGNYAEVSYERGVHINSNPIIRKFLSQGLGVVQLILGKFEIHGKAYQYGQLSPELLCCAVVGFTFS